MRLTLEDGVEHVLFSEEIVHLQNRQYSSFMICGMHALYIPCRACVFLRRDRASADHNIHHSCPASCMHCIYIFHVHIPSRWSPRWHAYIHAHAHVCIHTYTKAHTHIHAYIHTYIHISRIKDTLHGKATDCHIRTYMHTYVHT
jgi:hypothetical protein